MLKTRFATLLFACAMILMSSLSVAAQEPDQEEEKKEEKIDPRLHFQIIPQKTVLLPGEPLKMTFILTNRSSDVITTREINIARGDVLLLISREEGPFQRYRGDWGFDDTMGDRIKLGPGKNLTAEAVVHFNHVSRSDSKILGTLYAFQHPGTYTLKARINCGTTSPVYAPAEPVKIRVKELQGVDAEVWERIKDDADVAYFIYGDGGAFVGSDNFPTRAQGKRVTQTLNDILSKYPNSSYSPYFKSALANNEKAMEDWNLSRLKRVEYILNQAGQYFQDGDKEYGMTRIPYAKDVAEEINLFPKDMPEEPYIGLAYLFNKSYSKALDYLEPFITSGQTGSDSRVLIEAVAFIHLFYNKQDRAADLLKITRSDQEQTSILNQFRDRIQKRQTFPLDIYH